MASDAQQYNRAVEKWRVLEKDKFFSRPAAEGVVGILCSYWPLNPDTYQAGKKEVKNKKILRKEALKIADITNERGNDTELVLNAHTSDFFDLLKDPKISDLILVGNGNFSSFYLPDSDISWADVGRESDHLKQGDFVQRHCGFFARNLSVPLGMFAVRNLSSVHAAAGYYIYPKGLNHPHAGLIQPVFEDGYLPDYEDIKRWFPKP